jgi:serine/threonine protein kinase
MAPETGTLKLINERSDIYSFGATMHRLATLQSALPALTAVLKGEREFEQQYVPAKAINPRVPAELSDLIGECLSYRPDHRPKNMAEVEKALALITQSYDNKPVSDG